MQGGEGSRGCEDGQQESAAQQERREVANQPPDQLWARLPCLGAERIPGHRFWPRPES